MIERIIIFKAGACPAEEPRYVREVCSAIGMSLGDAQGLRIEVRAVEASNLTEYYVREAAIAAGIPLEYSTVTPFDCRDGRSGFVLQVLARESVPSTGTPGFIGTQSRSGHSLALEVHCKLLPRPASLVVRTLNRRQYTAVAGPHRGTSFGLGDVVVAQGLRNAQKMYQPSVQFGRQIDRLSWDEPTMLSVPTGASLTFFASWKRLRFAKAVLNPRELSSAQTLSFLYVVEPRWFWLDGHILPI